MAVTEVFDRSLLRRRRARVAAQAETSDFLHAAVARDIAERLTLVSRSFDVAVDLGTHTGRLAAALATTPSVGTVIRTDTVPAYVAGKAQAVVCDEEALPFADGSLDLVASALALQWVNDLPGTLVQIRRALKADGLFIAGLLGAGSLDELRSALTRAEIEVHGGAGPRIAPFPDLRDVGALLQRAGFALPVVDVDTITVRYPSMLEVMRDLRAAGAANALIERPRTPLTRAVLRRAAEIYRDDYGDDDGRVRATFQVISLSAWSPHESQQKPLAPGTARTRLADALGTREIGGGEPAVPQPRDASEKKS